MISDKYFQLEIITPFQIIYQCQVEHLRAPGIEGYFGVLAGHEPFITTLRIGEIKVDLEKETKYFATSGGIIEVLPHKTTVLVETAEEAQSIDTQRARSSHERAKKRLTEKVVGTDIERARLALIKALNRLKVAKREKDV
jgi:F-type H+-transporting ATPase subunit epsilon